MPVRFMNYIGGGQFDVPLGKIVYTQFLNDRAGIEADVTVTRLSETCLSGGHPGCDPAGRSDVDDAPQRGVQRGDH